jgi:hypothetical protein
MLVYLLPQVLLEAGIKAADAVVLGSGGSAGGDLQSDARVLAAILQVGRTGALLHGQALRSYPVWYAVQAKNANAAVDGAVL